MNVYSSVGNFIMDCNHSKAAVFFIFSPSGKLGTLLLKEDMTLIKVWAFFFNPLSANSDQDQFSPSIIHTLSTDKL